MGVFSELFTDLTGWLTLAVIGFMLVMMGYLFYMFVHKANKGE